MQDLATYFGIIILFIIIILSSAIRILREYDRAVVFRLGRLIGAKGPGLILLIPVVDRMVRVSLRTVVMDVTPQDVITKDNVSLNVKSFVDFRVVQATTFITADARVFGDAPIAPCETP